MESFTELTIAVFIAGVLISLFAIARLALRSPSTPRWLTNDLTAYLFAVSFTVATAASLFNLGFAFNTFLDVATAGLATIAVHVALLALFRLILPVKAEVPAEATPAARPVMQLRSDDRVAA